MLVVDKPASIPVHPCGRFNMNSVASILASEFGRKDLRIVSAFTMKTKSAYIFSVEHAVGDYRNWSTSDCIIYLTNDMFGCAFNRWLFDCLGDV